MNVILSFYRSDFVAVGGVKHLEISNGERDENGEISYVLDMKLSEEAKELFCSSLCQFDPVNLSEGRVIVDLRGVNYLQIDSSVIIGKNGQMSFEILDRLNKKLK